MKTHDFGATYQEGIISAVDAANHKVRCKIPALEDLETAWLSYLTPNAGGNQFYCLPDEGELVAVLLDARGEGGCVLGAIYNEKDTTPANDNNMWVKKFTNGTVISHNRKSGEININTSGSVTVTAGGGVKINADTSISGKLTVSGKITSGTEVSAPKVKQGSIELGSHKHPGDSGGKTGLPE